MLKCLHDNDLRLCMSGFCFRLVWDFKRWNRVNLVEKVHSFLRDVQLDDQGFHGRLLFKDIALVFQTIRKTVLSI